MAAKKTEIGFRLDGVQPSPQDDRDWKYHLTGIVSFEPPLPAKFRVEQQAIRNQGPYNSCVGHGFAAAFECAVANRRPLIPPKPSEAWLKGQIVDAVTQRIIFKRPEIQVDYAKFSGTVQGAFVVKVPGMIVDGGKVVVMVNCEGYKTTVFELDFADQHTYTLRVNMVKLKSTFTGEPFSEMGPPKTKNWLDRLWDFLDGILHRADQIAGLTVQAYFSPKWLYSKCKQIDGNFNDSGTYPRNGGKVLLENGCTTETQCQYVSPIPADFSARKDLEALATANKIKSYSRLYTADEVKRALYNGMGVAFAVSDAALLSGLKQYEFPAYKKLDKWSAHCMSFSGWDETGIEVRNSWGDKWGKNGYAHIRYDSPWWRSIFDIWAVKV